MHSGQAIFSRQRYDALVLAIEHPIIESSHALGTPFDHRSEGGL
jgi:hypothetical protein